MADIDIVISHLAKPVSRRSSERFYDFNAVYLAGEARQNGRMVSGPRSRLEDDVVRVDLRECGHQGDQERLRDVLLMPDRQRDVEIREGAEFIRYKGMSRNFSERGDKCFIQCLHAGLLTHRRNIGNHLIDHIEAKRGEGFVGLYIR